MQFKPWQFMLWPVHLSKQAPSIRWIRGWEGSRTSSVIVAQRKILLPPGTEPFFSSL